VDAFPIIPSARAGDVVAAVSRVDPIDAPTQPARKVTMAAPSPAAGGAGGSRPAAGPVSSDAIRSAVKLDTCPYPLMPGPDKGGAHSYSHLAAESFKVRGPRYLTDKVKVDAAPAAFDLMHVELFLSHERIGNLAARRNSWLRKARAAGDTRYYLTIVYVTPAAPFIHVALYYAVDQGKVDANPALKKLWTQFTAHGEAADAFRNDRWKVIPRISEGSWVVSTAVGTKPALLAQKLTHTWIICDDVYDEPAAAGSSSGSARSGTSSGGSGGAAAAPPVVIASADTGCAPGALGGRARGESYITHTGPGPYIEADCDVASSQMAYMLVSLLQQYAKYVVIDLAFAIEPRAEDECPEVVLGTVRLHRIDVTAPPVIAAEAGDAVLGALGVTHSGDGEEGAGGAGSST